MTNIKRIFEDNHLLVVDKPVNMPVQEDQSGDPDLLNELKEYIRVEYSKPGNVYLGLVHRLDRPTGGVMVFAKTSKAASRLSDTIRRHKMTREYYAVLRGTHLPKSGTLKDYLYKDKQQNQVFVVEEGTNNAKEAILHYEVVEQLDDLTLVRIQLETGRSHQIRVQFASRGLPLWGDQKYGQQLNKVGQQLALYACELSFPHVTQKDIRTFSSLPPNEKPWSLFIYFNG